MLTTAATSDEGQVPTLTTKVANQRSAATSAVSHSATGGTDGGGLSGKTPDTSTVYDTQVHESLL